jgi:UDP-N-acetylmuramoylalanine--D-glutamate ligase
MAHALVVGLGITGRAVAGALVQRGHDVVAVDDRPDAGTRAAATALGIELVEAPDDTRYDALIAGADMVLPSPGLGDAHRSIVAARRLGVAVRSEFDLAADWDHRPLLAITGTDGKTTVTTLATAMLEASGVRAMAVGNTEVPLVAAIADPAIEVFVVEASSFRLEHSERFAPLVATWLNVAPDHLNLHRSYDDYVAAKARIWRDQDAASYAVGSADDPVVLDRLRQAPARHVTFGLAPEADYRVTDGRLVTPAGDELAVVDDLWRAFPHDVTNALAAAATALPGGASIDGCRAAISGFEGLPHRIALVADARGVAWYDDSKATTPNAALAAVRSFGSVVLIAGGRNKGLDLNVLAMESDRIRGVVAIGEAAAEVEAAFAGLRPVVAASSMGAAVKEAAAMAQQGDAVLLSPACASFDWYESYGERGDDFAIHVRTLTGAQD